MRYEYLLFNIIIVLVPFIYSVRIFCSKTDAAQKQKKILICLFISCFLVAIPFIIWDIYVNNLHWYFNKKYILGASVFTLPIEEILFFFTIPYATGCLWLLFFNTSIQHKQNTDLKQLNFLQHGHIHKTQAKKQLRWIYCISFIALPFAFLLLTQNTHSAKSNLFIENYTLSYGYTAFTLIVLSLAMFFDYAIGSRLLQQPRFYLFTLLYAFLNFSFNGYLTGRPIVLYYTGQYLGIRIGTTPIEDFFYGLSLFIFILSLLQHFTNTKGDESFFKKIIRWRLKNYKIQFNAIDTSLPTLLSDTPVKKQRNCKVAVVGAGIAGISSAIILAERGFTVELFEEKKHLGGKCASWKKNIKNLGTCTIDHGFHGFFQCYYNLLDFLEKQGILYNNTAFANTYTLVNKEKKIYHLDDKSPTPIYNILDLANKKIFNLPKLMLSASSFKLIATLTYDLEKTNKKYDNVSFQDFKKQSKLPPDIAFILTLFARAFFATDDKISTAQLLKNFHAYYLSNDKGLLYHYLNLNYLEGFITPLRKKMQDLSITIRTNSPIRTIEKRNEKNKHQSLTLYDEYNNSYSDYDEVIIACHVQATKKIILNSPMFDESLSTTMHNNANAKMNQHDTVSVRHQLAQITTNQRYSIYRIWIKDCTLPFENYSFFTSFERMLLLDALTQVEHYDTESKEWAKNHNGHVLELHCYAIPDAIKNENDIKTAFLQDLLYYFPQFNETAIQHEDMQINNDFTPFTTGSNMYKPTSYTGIDGCYFAGDWVSLPIPCSLLESAHSSARFAANIILSKYQLQEIPIYSVPLKGLFSL